MQDETQQQQRTPWPINADGHAYMRKRQAQNRVNARRSKAEQWMAAKLRLETPYKWTPQAQSGFRIFDFWNHQTGVAVEVDGPEHNVADDAARDHAVMGQRGILVVRVRNFNEADAAVAIQAIALAESWNERRRALGLAPVRGADLPA